MCPPGPGTFPERSVHLTEGERIASWGSSWFQRKPESRWPHGALALAAFPVLGAEVAVGPGQQPGHPGASCWPVPLGPPPHAHSSDPLCSVAGPHLEEASGPSPQRLATPGPPSRPHPGRAPDSPVPWTWSTGPVSAKLGDNAEGASRPQHVHPCTPGHSLLQRGTRWGRWWARGAQSYWEMWEPSLWPEVMPSDFLE